MATKKNGKADQSNLARPMERGAADAPAEVPDLRANVLDARERDLLARGQRMLTMIQSPTYAARAARSGYTSEEHKEGWTLLNLASGQGRRLDDCFLATRTNPAQGYDMTLLISIDEFENTWFPRTRAIIRRVVSNDRRDEFESAFFKDLEQQPLGPSVVPSVRAYLLRVDDLEKSQEPNAKDVLAKLASRGLTQAVRAQMSELVKRAEEGGEVADVATMAKVAEGQKAQVEALARFRDWFNDWATTLRTVFPSVRAQIQLGLTTVSRSSGSADDVVEEPVVAPEPAPRVPGTPNA